QEVRDVRDVLVGEVRPGWHRRVGHAAPDDVDEVLVRRQRSAGSCPDLEFAAREIAGPWTQVRSGVAFAVSVLAVALRAVLEIELLARLPLRIGARVGCRGAPRSRRRRPYHDDPDRESPAHHQARGHFFASPSLARGLEPVKSYR